jgi:8-amino-7-oxononanoate synthase
MIRKPGILDQGRENLLRRVELMRQSRKPHPAPAPVVASSAKPATDFSTLPGYDQIRMLRQVGDKLGLGNPYFSVHDGRPGAETRINGRTLRNFSSYDYLGLNGHPEVSAAAKEAIDRYGISATASRLIAGERPIHGALERALADHYEVDDCLVFVSGYATNLGVIGQLVGAKDLVIVDSVIHNSAVLGGVLSGATRRNFSHNDLDNLEEVLVTCRGNYERVLIVVEGVYSMHGDYPDLRRLIEIKKRHEAWLMVDEAHALGVLGTRGYGLAEHFGVDGREVDIWMGTLSKTLAGCGGYIAGPAELIDYLRYSVGAFVYSVGMPPLIAAAVAKALEIMHREPERVAKLQQNAALFHRLARERELDTGTAAGTAIAPIIVGDTLPAAILAHRLFERGINVQALMYPAVLAKEARLRFFVMATHTEADIEAAIDATSEELRTMRKGASKMFTLAAAMLRPS